MSEELLGKIATRTQGGLLLRVKAKPGAKREGPLKIVDCGDGLFALEVSVPALPQEGKANAALAARLAGELGLKKKDVSIRAGATGRLKLVDLAGDGAALWEKLARAL